MWIQPIRDSLWLMCGIAWCSPCLNTVARDGELIQTQHFCHHLDTICHPNSSYVITKLYGHSERAIFTFLTMTYGHVMRRDDEYVGKDLWGWEEKERKTEAEVDGHMGDISSSWRTQKNGLPQGSVLAPTLFNLYINDLPATTCRKFIYADDICLAHQARKFEDLNTTINTDIAKISEFCKRWRLQPSLAKTVSSTFHLHNARINQELDITLNGKRLRHDNRPTYLGVTLDCTARSPTNPIFGRWLQKPELVTIWCTC